MPEILSAGNDTLILNGAGVRTYAIEIYAAGLFLKKKNSDANAIINADEPMALRLHILTDIITSEIMKNVFLEGFQKYNDGKTAPLNDKIDAFISVFNDDINPNDVYDFIYIPTEGLKVFKNKELKNTTKSLDFKKAIFRIWLPEKPSDEDKKDLKNAMLGGK